MGEIKQVTQSPIDDESQLKVLRSVTRALLMIAIIGILFGSMQLFSSFSLFLRGIISFGTFIFLGPSSLVGGLMFLFLRKGLLQQERWSYTIIFRISVFLIVLGIIQIAISLVQENFTLFSLISFLIPVLLIYYIKKLSPILTKEREGTPLRYIGAVITVSFVVLINLGLTFLLIANFK